MSDQVTVADFSELVTLATVSALDAGQWQGFTDRLSALAGGIATHILGFDTQGTETGFVATGYDPAYLTSYAQHYSNQNPWSPDFLNRRVGEVVDSRTMCPDEALFRTEFYQDWVRPQEDIRLGGGAMLATGPDGTFLLGGNIPSRMGDEATAGWLSLVGQLVPHLRASWQVARRLTAARLSQRLGDAVIVVTRGGRVLFQNDRAEGLLAQGVPLGVGLSGRLQAARQTLSTWLEDYLARLDESDLPQPDRTTSLGWTVRAAPVSAEVLGRTWPLALTGCEGACVCLTLERHGNKPQPDDVALRRLGLTPSELAVGRALARGLSPAAIAEARQVSIHTVRNQIKSAMWKCGVSRQTQLVALINRLGG